MTEPPYVELRCRSAFSFLRGAALPEELAARAAALGYGALALSDTDGVYGAPRFHRAARQAGLRPIVGAEVLVAGHPLLLLCEGRAGYQHLCRLLTDGRMRGPLGLSEVAAQAGGLHALSGGAEGLVGAALSRGDFAAAGEALDGLLSIFGPEHLAVELQVHLDEGGDRRNAALCELARRYRLPLVLTNDVRCATPEQADLLDVLTCVAEGVTLDRAGTRLLRNAERHLKAPADMAALLPDLPEAVDNTLVIAARCGFTLDDLGYRFPDYPLPPGEDAAGFLRHLVQDAAPTRFRDFSPRVTAQLERELALIEKLHLSGYFLIVWDLIQFCRSREILVQGRGSAANSAVCFALGITACDPLHYELLFERFLSEERGEWPDIDLDLPAGARREEVIQYVYRKYGERGCALVANVVSYRARSAVRDVGKALGFDEERLGRLAGRLDRLHESEVLESTLLREAGFDPAEPEVRRLLRLCGEIQDLPRHLSQHPGGMVLAAGRLDEVVPLQPAALPARAGADPGGPGGPPLRRVIIQWDKDECAALGLIKIDLLGLGMMAALEEAARLCPAHDGVPFDLAAVPPDDPGVYEMLQRADTVGVFQVESRAQMATLPRLRPRCFYDLVVEVALIRPGPIIGKLVHPYLRRRAGREPVTYPHPLLEPVLRRTLGVPLFQEQVMRVAMIAAGFSGGQAEALRRAMGFKRSDVKMAALREDLVAGMRQQGIDGAAMEAILGGISSFAAYGFPESHAISFALIAYASAYLKVHHPGVFYASLLNAWPMGFYQPATLVKDAERHRVRVLPVDVNHSRWRCSLSGGDTPMRQVRLGLRFVRGLQKEAGAELVAGRADGPFRSLAELRRRCPGLRRDELEVLAEIGALGDLSGRPSRREALWQVSALGAGPLLDTAEDEDGPPGSPLAEMTAAERLRADYRGTGMTVGPHPLFFHREELRRRGVLRSDELLSARDGARVQVAGVVIVRQRPSTAKGYFFLTLEDEAGLANVIVAPPVFHEHRAVLVSAPALVVDGVLQREGTPSVKGQGFTGLQDVCASPSHDFH